jgi:hypothetical protein
MERPILFSGPMVRALLEGRKVQTRRIMKVQPPSERHELWWTADTTNAVERRKMKAGPRGSWLDMSSPRADRDGSEPFGCPYGVPGDRLWVRENFYLCNWIHWPDLPHRVNPVDKHDVAFFAATFDRCTPRERPSIHMPRWASRLTLEVTEVRVERLQAISEDDARAEGVIGATRDGGRQVSHRDAFAHLWNSINGPSSWAANPFVWAVSFRVVTS